VAGGYIIFRDDSSAAEATLIANGGSGGPDSGGAIYFQQSLSTTGPPDGGICRVEVFGNGKLDLSGVYFAPEITIGSLQGDGNVFLGSENLKIGRNNLNEKFSGVIQDGGINGGSAGSLTKIGTGTITLSHFNTYTGGTFVKRGKLVVDNSGGSGTGTGPVQVERGTLGGKGIIEGAVTIGTGSGSGAVLSPGHVHGPERLSALTINSALTFNLDGAYEAQVNSSTSMADEVAAVGVRINPGAQFSFSDIGSGILPIGTTFTVINNTSVNPIVGTFSNLADGATFTSNGNTYQANYEGGDGNDLTLTVQ
jgi:autotransporter-associated beta strand protein